MLSFFGCAQIFKPAPEITEGEFPFVLEYELDGKRYLIEDTVCCYFEGYDTTNAFTPICPRTWHQSLNSGDESKRILLELAPNLESVLVKDRINEESRVILYYGDGGYYLGDPDYANRCPSIKYVEKYKTSEKVWHSEHTELSYEELEEFFGIKIIRFEFSNPIENKFINN